MIAKVIGRWLRLPVAGGNRPLGIVLHTGCLNYETDQLRRLGEMGCRLILPDNVYWELRLLTASKTDYGTRARALLEGKPGAIRVPWDLEQLYLPGLGGLSRRKLHDGPLLFLFGDLNKQDEFLQNVRALEDSHILIHSDWERTRTPVVCRLDLVRGGAYRRAIPLSGPAAVPELTGLTGIRCVSAVSSRRVSGREFQKTSMSGNYSQIYTHEAYRGRYFKIYRKAAQTDSACKKLEALESYVRERPIPCAAIPEVLLYSADGGILGYGMPVLQGRPLGEFSENGWIGKTPEQIGKIVQDLLLLLLELHLQGILVNDLSYNNILISGENSVYLVDFDTVQFRSYPGGQITELYRHPEIRRGGEREELRQPRHEYFALAVLLFQCLMYDDPLYGASARWTENKFALGENARFRNGANEALWDNWQQLAPGLRRMFSDVFHFRRDYSIGAWYRGLSENS